MTVIQCFSSNYHLQKRSLPCSDRKSPKLVIKQFFTFVKGIVAGWLEAGNFFYINYLKVSTNYGMVYMAFFRRIQILLNRFSI